MSLVVSLCILRFEIRNPSEDMNSKGSKSRLQDRRQLKDLKIETYTNKTSTVTSLLPCNDRSSFSSEKAKNTPACSLNNKECSPGGSKETHDQVAFMSGNPFVEVTKGILHLYKEDVLTVVDHEAFYSQIVCMLAVPSTMACHDLLNYTSPWQNNIQHIRIIRDGAINQYMAIVYFRSKESTVDFYNACNGTPFNSLEPEHVCQLVYVSRVEVLNEVESRSPPSGHTELPTCPVCLERMDESVDGILTILCNHSFHSNCLVKWGDISCPVCRYVQTPEMVAENKCFVCHASESLWICLICGYVGCGRYVKGHARKHYMETSHCYSMQLGNNRVWDYAGDNFVHRLLQNKTDGKLVEGPSPEKSNGTGDMDEKLESIQLEYTYLLTSQLESQRAYYEEKIEKLKRDLNAGVYSLKGDAKRMASEKVDLETKLNSTIKEKQAIEKKVTQLSARLSQNQAELQDEKQISHSLQMNQSEWQKKFTDLETEFKTYKTNKELELNEMKEQLRDVMFYLQAQKSIEQSEQREDIAGGTIVLAESSSNPKSTKKGRRNRR